MRISEAAKRLGISKQALKLYIRRLELEARYVSKRSPGGFYRFDEEDIRFLNHLMNYEGSHRFPELRFRQRRARPYHPPVTGLTYSEKPQSEKPQHERPSYVELPRKTEQEGWM